MDFRAASRYAKALLAAAKSEGSIREAEDDLKAITSILEARPDFKEALESPIVTNDRKLALIDKLFSDRARPITMRLLRLLIKKNREDELTVLYNEFVRLREESEGVLHLTIRSAVPLSEDEVNRIVKKIESQTGKKCATDLEVEPSLVGGIVAQYGDYVLDGSVKGALRRLKEKLYVDVLKQA